MRDFIFRKSIKDKKINSESISKKDEHKHDKKVKKSIKSK